MSGWRQRAVRTLRFLYTLFGPGLGADGSVPAQLVARFPSGVAFRDDVLRRYPFTPAAREVLQTVPFTVRNLAQPVGGGGWYGPLGRRIELAGIQDEAAVHELAHAWADLAGFYREYDPAGPTWPTWHRAFRAAVHRAATEPDPRYRRVQFLAHQYEFGDPAINFPGMGTNDPERFAGLASGTMGDLSLMPPYLAQWYAGLFAVPTAMQQHEAG